MQLGMPSAPTDSLYKFFAIFCFMFAGVLFFYADFMENKAREAVVEFSKTSTNRFYELVEGYAKDKPEVDMKIMQEKANDLGHTEGLEAISAAKRSDYYRALRNWGCPILVVLSLIGFLFWYLKTQRYQDVILKKQAENT